MDYKQFIICNRMNKFELFLKFYYVTFDYSFNSDRSTYTILLHCSQLGHKIYCMLRSIISINYYYYYIIILLFIVIVVVVVVKSFR